MSFTFIHLTDHHLGDTEHAYIRGFAPAHSFARVLEDIASHDAWDADFLMFTGDLANLGTDAEYAFARRLLDIRGTADAPGPLSVAAGRAGRRVSAYFMPGNHDVREAFHRNLFGKPPTSLVTSFTHKGVQFVCVDTGTGSRQGDLSDSAIRAVAGRLRDGTPSIVCLHHHPIAVGIAWLDAAVLARAQELWNTIASARVLGVLFGHVHSTVEAQVGSVPVLSLRSTCFQFVPSDAPLLCLLPPHYRIVTVTGDRLGSQIREVMV
jgi:Icc protein